MKKTDMLQGESWKIPSDICYAHDSGQFIPTILQYDGQPDCGRFVGEDALAAVGASYSLTTVFIMIAIGGGMGASVLTSQYLGAGQHGKMKTSVYTALITFLILSILLTVFGLAMNPAILRALNTPENIFDDAVLYLQIYFMGLPFLFSTIFSRPCSTPWENQKFPCFC